MMNTAVVLQLTPRGIVLLQKLIISEPVRWLPLPSMGHKASLAYLKEPVNFPYCIKMNPIHALPVYLWNINFNVILSSIYGNMSWKKKLKPQILGLITQWKWRLIFPLQQLIRNEPVNPSSPAFCSADTKVLFPGRVCNLTLICI
jgi:hypothetical protein